jgi:hypothetical protein
MYEVSLIAIQSPSITAKWQLTLKSLACLQEAIISVKMVIACALTSPRCTSNAIPLQIPLDPLIWELLTTML